MKSTDIKFRLIHRTSSSMSYRNGVCKYGDLKSESGYYLATSNNNMDIVKIETLVKLLNLNLEDFKNMLISQGAIPSKIDEELYFTTKEASDVIVDAFKLQEKFQIMENIING